MQLKNMREILPNLCIDQEERNNVLVSSPIQANGDKVNQPSKHRSRSCSQVTEPEGGKPSLVLCKNCSSLFEPLSQFPKHDQLRRTEEKNAFLCSRCSLSLSSCFSNMNGAINSTNIDEKKYISDKMERKTAKTIALEKYHCDKCRFTTKDHLLYQKHALLHEEIKFICSHCNYVSYTKGEFQRHLVKHTGTFPYKCEYCEYGAVRNDYIVKHTRRVHEGTHEIHHADIINKNQSRHSMHKEKTSARKSSFQKISNSSTVLACHDIQSEALSTGCLYSSVEYNKLESFVKESDVKLNTNGGSLLKDEEDRNLEVELVSPLNEPLLPDMTLTAVAPPDLVIPSHSFAQLVEVKVIDGKRQLVLKLFPQNERCFELVNTETCTSISGQILHELNNSVFDEQSGPLITNSAYEDTSQMYCSSLTPKSEDNMKNSSGFCSDSCSSNMKLISALVNHTMEEEPLKDICFKSSVTNGFSETRDIHSSEVKGGHQFYVMNKLAESSSDKTSTCISLFSAAPSKDDIAQMALESKNDYCSSQVDLSIDKDAGNKDSLDTIHTSFHSCLSNAYLTKEPVKISATEIDSSFCKSVCSPLDDNDNDFSLYQSPDDVFSFPVAHLEEQYKEVNMNISEGPYISSVFSLSSIENIPEGIEWNENLPSKTEPRTLSSGSTFVTHCSMMPPPSVLLAKSVHSNDSDLMNGSVSTDGHFDCQPSCLWKGNFTQKDKNIFLPKVHHADNCTSSDIGKYVDEHFNLKTNRDACLPKQIICPVVCKQKHNSEADLSPSCILHLSKTEENLLANKLKTSETLPKNCGGNGDVLEPAVSNVGKKNHSNANRNFNVVHCSKEAYSVIEQNENGQNQSLNRENAELSSQVPDLLCSINHLESHLLPKENEMANDQLPTTAAAGLQSTEKDQLHLENEPCLLPKENEMPDNQLPTTAGLQSTEKDQLHLENEPRLLPKENEMANDQLPTTAGLQSTEKDQLHLENERCLLPKENEMPDNQLPTTAGLQSTEKDQLHLENEPRLLPKENEMANDQLPTTAGLQSTEKDQLHLEYEPRLLPKENEMANDQLPTTAGLQSTEKDQLHLEYEPRLLPKENEMANDQLPTTAGLQSTEKDQLHLEYEPRLLPKENEMANVQLPITASLQSTEKDQLHLENEPNSVMKYTMLVNETDQNMFHQDLGRPNEPSRKEQLHFSQAPPQVHGVKSKRGLAKNVNIGNPVFIPKGTVLRVVNSNSNNSGEMDRSTSISVHSVNCSETLLPRPVPFTISEKLVDLSLSMKNELYKFRNPRRSFSHKLGQELDLKLSLKKCTTKLDGKCDNLNKQKVELKRPASPQNKIKQIRSEDHFQKKKVKLQLDKGDVCNEKEALTRARRLRLMPVSASQLIKCPRRNQPVVVLNHPDVDSLEVVNVMKTISKYKANVLKVILSERTIYCLGIKQYQKRLMYQSWEVKTPAKELKMKLKKVHKSYCRETSGITDDSLLNVFKCWFCGRHYENQEEWISHGQRHLIESTRDWDNLFPSEIHN
ncbi:LOW QUALITY PROTEIN: zinc finger protein 518B [Microcaecilia unicolor]|uniref:LOW QUALITY PROTEIN: zinc finger protein 518B n=1 Tax=Microcaecilia unicolor TaxID=1415580 RepID=A0A6P7X3M1_9AMPH|nr:LOW QUALITY PROTEIN: zinc finger protein 518B [Microcaecilia unicolor]